MSVLDTMNDDFRNPLILPQQAPKKRCCPKCGNEDFTGRKIMGAITWICLDKKCNNQWAGGLPDDRLPHGTPMPAQDPLAPRVTPIGEDARTGNVIDEVRRYPVTQPYRSGSPTGGEGEDV